MFKRSLALRILVINVFFLILPTFLWLGFFFEKSRSESITETLYHMRDLAYSRSVKVEGHTLFCEDVLTVLISDFGLNHPDSLTQDTLVLQFKKVIATVPIFENLIYSKKTEDNHFVIWASTLAGDKAQVDVTDHLFITSAFKTGASMTLGFAPDGTPLAFVTRLIESPDHKVTGALTFAADPHNFLIKGGGAEYSLLKTHFGFDTVEGITFAVDDPSLEMLAIFPLTSEQIKDLTRQGVYNPQKIRPYLVTRLEIPPFKGLFEITWKGEQRLDFTWPISGSNSMLVIGVDVQALLTSFYQHLWKSLILVGMACLLSSSIIWVLSRRLSRPLEQFMKVINETKAGNLEARFVKDDVGYEINEVGDAVNRMLVNLQLQMETVQTEMIKQELATRELKIGHQIQQQLLPARLPEVPGVTMAATALPALEVGGDFYDLFFMDENGSKKLFLTIADGAGKGVSACLYSLGLKSILRSYAVLSKEAGSIVKEANNLFCQDTSISSMFATAFIGVFDPGTRQFDYYSAGHPPALVRHQDGTVEKLWTPGAPLGISPIEAIEQKGIKLLPGDVLLLYTDGVTEAMNQAGQLYGEERLVDFLKNQSIQSAQLMLDALMENIETFESGAKQNDDITVILITIA